MKNKARGNEAEMANIARGEAECYISIEAECRVLYFSYSTRGNALTVIENFLYKFMRHYKTSNLTNLSAERL